MKIQFLKVETANFDDQLEFYQDTLGLEISIKTQNRFSIKIGYSVLEFHRSEQSVPYHIAFHIGAHQEKKALDWLRKRVAILTDDNNEIIDFPAWNAKSIYFYDKDQNIIEFISRKNGSTPETIFSAKSLVGIAEIGLPTNSLKENIEFLNLCFGLEIYWGSPEKFCAIGDEKGLLIAVDPNKKTWFPTNDKTLPADFDLKFERKGKVFELVYENGKLDLM